MSRPYKQTRSLIRLVNARWSAEGRACHYILRTSVGGTGEKPKTRNKGLLAEFAAPRLTVHGQTVHGPTNHVHLPLSRASH